MDCNTREFAEDSAQAAAADTIFVLEEARLVQVGGGCGEVMPY